jgi:hypothetical protein
MVADELAATVDESGWPAREARAVLLAVAGGRALDTAAVWAIVRRLETLWVPAG